MADPHVVILGHAADRTGPPIYLLQLLRALDRRGLRTTVVLLRGGELLGELQELAEVRVVGEPVDESIASPTRLAEEPARLEARRAQLADLVDLSLVVVNTAWSIHALPWLPAGRHPVVSVVHELGAGVGDLLAPGPLADLLASDRFVAGCRAVVAMLVDDHDVAPDRIDLIPYGVEVGRTDVVPAHRGVLGADPSSFLVVAAAVADRRKSPDLFVHLAATARRRRPDIAWAFRWIGADWDDERKRETYKNLAYADNTFIGPYAAHEGVPGHHLQLSIARLNPDPIRSILYDSVQCEGWALYAEEMFFQSGGFAGAPRAELDTLSSYRARIRRVFYDVNIETGRWTLQQGADWKYNAEPGQGKLDEDLCRSIHWPTQLIGYFTGKMQILSLKKECQAAWGKDYSDRRFHDELLRAGSIPLALVRAELLKLDVPPL